MHKIEAIDRAHFGGLMDLLDLVFGRGESNPMRACVPIQFVESNWGNLRVILDGERVVSHIGLLFRDASVVGHRIRIALVGAVATHPDYRGQGLATELLHHCFDLARGRGAHLLQISGGRGLYLRNGSRQVGNRLEHWLGPAELAAADTDGWAVRPMTEVDIDAAAALYGLKAVRYVRPKEDWVLQVRHGSAHAGTGLFRVVERDGRMAAYTVHSPPRKEGDAFVHEYAGAARAVLAGLRHIASEPGVSRLKLSVMPWDVEMLDVLGARNIGFERQPCEGTIRMVDFVGLMRSLDGLFVERLGATGASELSFREEGGCFVFALGDDRLEVSDPGELVEGIFGVRGTLHGLPATHAGPAGKVLRRILPIPLPTYDLTYI